MRRVILLLSLTDSYGQPVLGFAAGGHYDVNRIFYIKAGGYFSLLANSKEFGTNALNKAQINST